MKKNINKLFLGMGVLFFICGMFSCKDPETGMNPYADGQQQLSIKFQHLNRKLDAVRPGEVFQVAIKGLKGQNEEISASINEEFTEIVSFTDSTLDLRVPQYVSSGGLKIVVGNQVFYGPRVPIEGRVKVDTDTEITTGFNATVSQILPNGQNYWVVGYFMNFQDEVIKDEIYRNGIHSINSLGKSIDNEFGEGGSGGINSIARLSDGKYIVAGNLYEFDKHSVSGITKLESSGKLETEIIDVINPDPDKPLNSLDTVPTFNARMIGGGVQKVFPVSDNKIMVIGNFTNHYRADYMFSSREQVNYFNTPVRNLARLKYDGGIDSTFMYGNAGANGTISDAVQLSNGKIVAVGNFTSFNQEVVNHILVINPDGTIDKTFAGSGANQSIFSITYNPVVKKIALAGRFTNFNGTAVNGVVLLDENGVVDPQFRLKDTENRSPNYAYAMNNGKVLVTGGFEKYEDVQRSNLLILEADGSAKQEYNNMGGFMGSINSIVETSSSEGYPALLIGGSVFTVDGERVGNIVRLEIRN